VLNLGLIEYARAMDVQRKVHREVTCGNSCDTLIVCEHPPVITFGRASKKSSLLVSEKAIRERGIEFCLTDRGGDVTYHGPGQAVFYPVFDLKGLKKDLHFFLRLLEESVIRPLRENFGLNAYRRQGMTGVWVGPYKVGFIGIGVRNWVTYHGISLNISVDIDPFSLIRPCGLDLKVGTMSNFFKDEISFKKICDMIVENIKQLVCEKGSFDEFLREPED